MSFKFSSEIEVLTLEFIFSFEYSISAKEFSHY